MYKLLLCIGISASFVGLQGGDEPDDNAHIIQDNQRAFSRADCRAHSRSSHPSVEEGGHHRFRTEIPASDVSAYIKALSKHAQTSSNKVSVVLPAGSQSSPSRPVDNRIDSRHSLYVHNSKSGIAESPSKPVSCCRRILLAIFCCQCPNKQP